MPPAVLTIFLAALAYMLGSVPFGLVIGKAFCGIDPRQGGSGNVGATNVARLCGAKWGALTLACDVLKGFLPVLASRHFFAEDAPHLFLAVGLAVVAGHMFSLFLRFKGGKGVATAAGVLFALDPLLGLGVLGTWLGVAVVLRYSSLAALVAAACAPLYAFLLWGGDNQVVAVGIIAMALIGKHWGNLQRLMAGTEPKIGAGKKGAATPVPSAPAAKPGKSRKGRR